MRATNELVYAKPTILKRAVTDSFGGTYSHDGLVDIRALKVWIARRGKPVGHSMLVEGNRGAYDLFFTFRFYVPGEGPDRLGDVVFAPDRANLLVRFVHFWDYRTQMVVPEWDERRTSRNVSQQAVYAVTAIRFYQQCRLPYAVDVHALGALSGSGPESDQYYVWQIPPTAGARVDGFEPSIEPVALRPARPSKRYLSLL